MSESIVGEYHEKQDDLKTIFGQLENVGSLDFERSYNLDYGIDDGKNIPFIHNRLELKKLLSPLYIIEDYLSSYELYDQLYEKISNIVKGCFVIRACREYPVNFKFYRTDKKTHTVELRHFLLNLMSWRCFVELEGIHILDETFILDPYKDTIYLDDYINQKVILPLREHHVKPTTVNLSTSEVCCRYRTISEDYSLIMNLNFGYHTFLELYQNNPKAREIMEARYNDLHQPSEIEERVNEYQNILIDMLKADPNNPIGVMLRADTGIKHKQLSEFTIAESLKPSLEGKTIPIPIENSTLVGGLDRPSYLYIDAIGARKSLVTNKKVMGNAGYFGKSLTLLVRTLRMSKTVADCGSTHLIPYEIKTKKHLEKLDGKYYKYSLDDFDYEVLNANTDKHLIGKTLYFRSVITCCLEDEVCPRCIGLTANINEDIADGFAAFQTEETTKKVNQDVLSTKHLLTTNSEVILFSEGFFDFFTLTQSEIYPLVNNNPVYDDTINNYGIYIDPADVQKVSELDEHSLYNTVIDTGRFYIRDLTGNEPDRMICTINKEGNPEDREIYITKEATDIMKRNRNVIPFAEIDDDTKLFEVIINNNELTKPLYDMMALINKRRKIENETIASMAQKLLDLLISAGIKATATSSEMIINRMIRKMSNVYERPDFSQKREPKYQIVTARKALERNQSPFIGLSFQDIKRQMLSNELYTIRDHTSYLDPLFKTDVDMSRLKEYAGELDPVKREAYNKERESYLAQTFYNKEYREQLRNEWIQDYKH